MDSRVLEGLIKPANTGIKLGLERVKAILILLGNPQDCAKVIHITGTNGKGSTASFIETGLIHAGYKVGKYTSPHINIINETITLSGKPISDIDLERAFFHISTIQKQHEIELSPFELLTVIMFYYFKEQGIDYLVLEVGMGGENDATNVINSPICAIITNISLEHTNWFGNTLVDVAREKSGIIKSCPVIIADSGIELYEAVESKASKVINILKKYIININLNFSDFTTDLQFNEPEENAVLHSYNLSLFGKFQAYNFLCALEVFKLLEIPEYSIQYAAQYTIWPGRLQKISTSPLVLVDATHNEGGAKVLYDTLAEYYSRSDVIIITSILADKNIPSILNYFNKIADTLVFTSITNTNRGLPADALYKKAQECSLHLSPVMHSISNPHHALEFAKNTGKKLILITGSLYLLQYYKLS